MALYTHVSWGEHFGWPLAWCHAWRTVFPRSVPPETEHCIDNYIIVNQYIILKEFVYQSIEESSIPPSFHVLHPGRGHLYLFVFDAGCSSWCSITLITIFVPTLMLGHCCSVSWTTCLPSSMDRSYPSEPLCIYSCNTRSSFVFCMKVTLSTALNCCGVVMINT